MNDFIGNGAGPAALGAPGGVAIACYPGEVYQTPVLDLTQVALGIELVSAKPGYFPVIINGWWRLEVLSGRQFTPAQVRAGSNATRNNLFTISNSPDTANVNVSVQKGQLIASLGLDNTLARIPNATVFLDVATGAVGTDSSFALQASLAVYVLWLPG